MIRYPHTILFLTLLTALLVALVSNVEMLDGHSLDLACFWGAAKLFRDGQNPYDIETLHRLVETTTGQAATRLFVWYPPSAFCFIFPFALVSFGLLKSAWFVICIVLFATAYILLDSQTSKMKIRSLFIIELLFFLSFHPMLSTLQYGQAAFIVFLSVMCFVFVIRKGQNSILLRFLAGALLSVTLIKPHLLFVFYIALCIERLRTRDWVFLGAFAMGGLLALLIPLLIQPHIYDYYFVALPYAPTHLFNPTLGSWLQFLFPETGNVLKFAPTVVVALVITIWSLKTKDSLAQKRAPLLIGISLCASPYLWLYDFMLLLPILTLAFSAIHALPHENRCRAFALVVGFVLINIIAFLQPSKMQYFVWYPYAILLLCSWAERGTEK